MFCPAVGYTLVYDAADGDKCVGDGDGASNWTAPLGCQDSITYVPELNGVGMEPRVIVSPCYYVEGHSNAWKSYVGRCQVEKVDEEGGSRHAATVLYNDRGDELQVTRVIHWGQAREWAWFLCDCDPDGTARNSDEPCNKAPQSIFGVGDTIYVRYVDRAAVAAGTPQSIIPGVDMDACDISAVPYPLSL